MSLFKNIQKCQTKEQNNCSASILENLFLGPSFIQDFCTFQCPLECNRTEYNVYLSTNELLADKYIDYLNEYGKDFSITALDANVARKSFVKFDIYYDSLSYELSSESPKMDVVSFLANVGGNLGLFLGVSVISICEVIEALIEIWIFKRNNHKWKLITFSTKISFELLYDSTKMASLSSQRTKHSS